MATVRKVTTGSASKISTKPLDAQVITKVPPMLRRFWNFAQDMAKKFSRHLLKSRDEELLDAVIKEFK